MPNIRWHNTLPGPRTLTCRPPNSSLSRPFTRSTVEQGLMQAPRQVAGGEFRKGAREGRLARHPTRRLPAAQPTEQTLRPQPFHQRPGGGHVQHRLARKARANAGKSPVAGRGLQEAQAFERWREQQR